MVGPLWVSQVSNWAWVKIKPPKNRRFESIFPFTDRVPFWGYPIFAPPPDATGQRQPTTARKSALDRSIASSSAALHSHPGKQEFQQTDWMRFLWFPHVVWRVVLLLILF